MSDSHVLDGKQISTLSQLFRARVAATPEQSAYRHFDIGSKSWIQTSWYEISTEVARWQLALKREGLVSGDRVAVMLKNCREWVVFDQAALGLGLVVVPLYTEDRPDNVAYIVQQAQVKLLLVEGRRQWQRLAEVADALTGLQRIISVCTIEPEQKPLDPRLESLADWIFGLHGEFTALDVDPDTLATVVFTSGTTGRPKGVMLSHRNILSNLLSIVQIGEFKLGDRFLSFLPMSHMLERTAGYYLPMFTGGEVAYARSITQLGEDLQTIKPNVLISVPRIYEKVYARIMDGLKKQSATKQKLFHLAVEVGWEHFEFTQGRRGWGPRLLLQPLLKKLVGQKVMDRLGGEMRYAVCGGAALPPKIGRTFVGLGLTLLQGYGMTEASPVVTVNRPTDNIPDSIGTVLPDVQIKLGDNNELLVKGDNVMLGYWGNDEATAATVSADGWLRSGDQVRIDEQGHAFITGRLKEIIVLGNGEKVPPSDMEMAICMDPLIEQVMIVGEGRSCLAALAVLSLDEWQALATELGVDAEDPASLTQPFVEKAVLARMGKQLKGFPGYAQIRRVSLSLEPWSVDNGLLTPTLKIKRPQVAKLNEAVIASLYTGKYA